MHKVYWKSCEQIDCIVASGIRPSNVEYLGMLVDICKDIKQMEYFKAKIESLHSEDNVDSKTSVKKEHHNHSNHHTLDEVVKEYTMVAERYSNSMSEEDKDRVVALAQEMIDNANMVRGVLMSYDVDEDVKAKVNRIFK